MTQGAAGYERDFNYESTSNRLDTLHHRWGTQSSRAFEARFDYNTAGLRQIEQTSGAD